MESLAIPGTNSTPNVSFNPDGRLLLEGRSLPENVEIFYTPLEKWISALEAEKVQFDVNLEYFNSASSKKILELLKILDINSHVKNIQITWHYEEGDDDCLESGQIFEELLTRSAFRFVEYAEAA